MESGSGIGPENLLDLYMMIISGPLRTETHTFLQRQQVVQEALTTVSQGRWSFISSFFLGRLGSATLSLWVQVWYPG